MSIHEADRAYRPDAEAQRADLVLEGGGVKGIGLVGAVNTLREAGYSDVQRIAGTSAGAIVAAFVAAGMSPRRMHEVMRALDYRRFEDAGLLARFGLPGQAVELLRHGGTYRTDYLHRWVTDELASCGIRTWGDLRYDDPVADATLPPDERYRLVVIVSDLSRGRMLRLPWDYRRLCDLDPDAIPVADAVVASASIPFFFRAQRLTCGPAQHNQTLTLTDGGSLSCYPITIFDRQDGAPSRWPTIGVKLSVRQAPVAQWNPVTNPIQMFRRLFATMSSAHDTLYVDQASVQARTVFVDTTGISAVDFGLDAGTRDRLFGNGQRAARDFLSTWDWETWRQTYQLRGEDSPAAPSAAAAGPA